MRLIQTCCDRQAQEDIDVFLYGHGAEYREQWIERMLTTPSTRLPHLTFTVRGQWLGPPGKARLMPYGSLRYLARALLPDGRVLFPGPVWGDRRFAAYADADVFACTPTHREDILDDRSIVGRRRARRCFWEQCVN
jgi:hypothetical protein